MMKRYTMVAAIALLVFAVPVVTTTVAAPQSAIPAPAGATAETFKALNLFAEAFERVRADHVDPVSDDQLIEGAITGMLASLDAHSSYLNVKAYKDMQATTQGEFGGLGIEVTADNGAIKVVAPMDGTPGAKAGLKPGDLIVALDDMSILNLSLNEAVDKMRGQPGTPIKLTVKRGDQAPFDVSLVRAVIHVQSVRGHLERENIAYIRIASFAEQTAKELETTYTDIKQKAGGKLAGLVLDLRSDPGGLLDQAVAVSDAFLDHGEIVSTRGRRPDDAQRFNAHQGDITNGLPIVVLIDGGTASAAEIVAGALQDHHRAVLLGTRSFGKGSVQTIIPMAGGSALRLTTARYYTPSGRSIQAKGIEPDILVEPAKVEKLDLGERIHEADLKGALANPDDAQKEAAQAKDPAAAPAKETQPPKPGAKPAAKPADGTIVDYQLDRGLDLIKGVALFSKGVD
jgi:carboxyl-terminal processing protease